MGKEIDMISLIKLSTEDGKIVRHEDWYVYLTPSQLGPIRFHMLYCFSSFQEPISQ